MSYRYSNTDILNFPEKKIIFIHFFKKYPAENICYPSYGYPRFIYNHELVFMQGKSLEQKEMISIFKMAVWALRNTYRKGRVIYFSILMDFINLFKRRFALSQGADGESYSRKVGL